MRMSILAMALLCSVLTTYAQTQFASFSNRAEAPRLNAVMAEVDADAFVATTVLTLQFVHTGKDTAEARYRFQLDPGMAVTGFQLDLNGRFRDGTIEERWKARNAYQQVTGQRIDPALLEKQWGDYYSLRIFPVAPGGMRQVRIVVRQQLKCDSGFVRYRFPLSAAGKVAHFTASARVRYSEAPVMAGGFWGDHTFRLDGDRFRVARSESGGVALSMLAFALPLRGPLVSCPFEESGKKWLQVHLPSGPRQIRGFVFIGYRTAGKQWVNDRWAGSKGWQTLQVPADAGAQLDLIYSNGERQFSDHTIGLTPSMSCDSATAATLSTLVAYERLGWANWNELLYFGVRNGVVTERTAYLVLERIEDYIRYGIRPPKELEEACAERGYVWRDNTAPLRKWTDLEVLQAAAAEYNKRIFVCDPHGSSVVVRSMQSLPDMAATNAALGTAVATMAGTGSMPGQQGGLQEVVVTSLGMRRKAQEIGYATTTVRAEELASSHATNLGTALSGKVSGLVIQNNSASVNAVPRIVLRGMRSVTGNNNPLVVINGASIPSESLRYINPNDVERVDILKGTQAAALYGSEGVNGAIVVTLKQGRYFSWRDPNRPYKLKDMPDEDYVVTFREVRRSEKFEVYEALAADPSNHWNPLFYIEMAQELWRTGMRKEAYCALFDATLATEQNSARVLRSIAFVLEEWGLLDDAIRVHRQVRDKENDLQSAYDLGLVLYRAGQYQEAVDCFYGAIRRERYDYGYDYYGSRYLKGMVLQELNEVIARHREALDLSSIPADLIRPLKLPLRIQVQTSYSDWYYINLQVGLPGGKRVRWIENGDSTMEAGRVIGRNSYYYDPKGGDFAATRVLDGKYRVRLANYYDYGNYYGNKQPSVLRMLYRVEDRKGRIIWTSRAIVLNNQFGNVEVDEWEAPAGAVTRQEPRR